MKLTGYLNLTGVITCQTGLLIGGNDAFGIGGTDKRMIRESFSGNRPYIPGSSLKGKMRHLLEHALGKVVDDKVHFCEKNDNPENCPICRVFGNGKTENAEGLTRLVVRDLKLITEPNDAPVQAQSDLSAYCDRVSEYRLQNGGYVELKTENVINRKTGAADKPRHFERVPSGMKFSFDLLYRVFDQPSAEDPALNEDLRFFPFAAKALSLVSREYIGASGSRGYGRISLDHLRLTYSDALTLAEVWSGDIEALHDWRISDQLKAAVSSQPASEAPAPAQAAVIDGTESDKPTSASEGKDNEG